MSRPNPGALLEVSVNDNDDEVLEYEQSSDEEEERSEQDPSNSILLGGGVEPEPGASQSSGVPWMGVTRNSGPPVKLPKPVATIPTALLEKLQSLSILRVKCNLQCGYLFKNKFACGKRGKCIRYNDKFWTPIGFEKAVGCGYRRWTKSIRVALRDERFITLDQLIRLPEPILKLHDARLCRCRVCYHGRDRKREIVYASLQPPLSPEPAFPPVASNVSSAEKPSRDETEKPARKSSRVPKAVEQAGSADSKPKMVPDTCKNATERKHILEMMKRFGATNFQAIADGIGDPSITAERVEAIVRRLLKKIREEDALHGLYPLDSWLEEEDAAFSKSFNATRCWGVMFRLMAIKYHKESPKEDLDYSAIYEALADLMEGQPPKELRSLEGQKILQLCDRLKAFLEASDIRNHDLFLLNQLNLRSHLNWDQSISETIANSSSFLNPLQVPAELLVIDPDLVLVEAALSPSRSASASKSTTVNR